EEHHGEDPELVSLRRLAHCVRDRQPIDAGHRLDRLPAIDPMGDEQWVDEIARLETRLAYEPAQRARRTQPAQTGLGERHGGPEDTGGGWAGAAHRQRPAL